MSSATGVAGAIAEAWTAFAKFPVAVVMASVKLCVASAIRVSVNAPGGAAGGRMTASVRTSGVRGAETKPAIGESCLSGDSRGVLRARLWALGLRTGVVASGMLRPLAAGVCEPEEVTGTI